MKIFVVGLGLMGASFAEILNDLGHKVYGYDKHNETLEKAFADKIILSKDINEMIDSDIIMMCLYPKDNIKFIIEHKHLFKSQLITDISGTKEHMVEAIENILPNHRYVSTHPMAGREKVGYINKDKSMFKNANFLIIESKQSSQNDIKIIHDLAKSIGFGRVTLLSALEHDQLISHTSQLTHLLAVGLMLSDRSIHTKDATGDSFRDLTRIAKINENMWTELFIDNKKSLVEATDNFINVLENLKELIIKEDTNKLKELLKKSTEKRITFDENKT